MSTGDGGLELDLEREGSGHGSASSKKPKKERDWKSTGMSAAKFAVGFATIVAASWGALKPETEAKAEAAYVVTQFGIEALGEDMVETKAALSVLTKRYSDHLEAYHGLDKRLVRLEERLSLEFSGDEDMSDEQLDILAELDAIRRELEDKPMPPATSSSVKTKGTGGMKGDKKAESRPHIKYEGQQIKLPSPAELFE